jgi:uncharacterized protein YceK
MLRKNLIALAVTVLLNGCSSYPNQANKIDHCSSNISNVIVLGGCIADVADHISKKSSGKKCAQMTGERKKQCDEQVNAITKSIENNKNH